MNGTTDSDSPLNRQWILDHRPTGDFDGSCFSLTSSPLPAPGEGEVLVRVHWLGIDPTQRGWLNEADNYRDPIAVGAVMRGAGVGEVIESRSDQLPVGTWVYGEPGWQDFAVGPPGGCMASIRCPRASNPD